MPLFSSSRSRERRFLRPSHSGRRRPRTVRTSRKSRSARCAKGAALSRRAPRQQRANCCPTSRTTSWKNAPAQHSNCTHSRNSIRAPRSRSPIRSARQVARQRCHCRRSCSLRPCQCHRLCCCWRQSARLRRHCRRSCCPGAGCPLGSGQQSGQGGCRGDAFEVGAAAGAGEFGLQPLVGPGQ